MPGGFAGTVRYYINITWCIRKLCSETPTIRHDEVKYIYFVSKPIY